MRHSILQQVGLTCTIGIAGNKMQAKLGSDKNKPNGVGFIMESTKVATLSMEPVKIMPGVGEVKEKALNAAGIHTLQDVRNYLGDLTTVVGKDLGSKLPDLANGIDDRPVVANGPPKSISKEHTFTPTNQSNPTVLNGFLSSFADFIEAEMQKYGFVANTVFVVACDTFPKTYTRQKTLSVPVSTAKEILTAGESIVKEHNIYRQPLYKLGLGVTNLRPLGGVSIPKKKSRGKNGSPKADADGDSLSLFDSAKM